MTGETMLSRKAHGTIAGYPLLLVAAALLALAAGRIEAACV